MVQKSHYLIKIIVTHNNMHYDRLIGMLLVSRSGIVEENVERLVKISGDNIPAGERSSGYPKRRWSDLRGDCKPYPHNVKLVNF